MDFTKVIDNAKRFAGKTDDDNVYDDLLVERLHNRYTVAALVCFCIAISTYQYAGNPIRCWTPAQFTNNYEDYTNRLCYLQNTYHIPKDQLVPPDANFRRERTLKYYQWINFVLIFQALLFSIPRILWQSFDDRSGLSVANLVDASRKSESFDTEKDRSKAIHYIADCLQRYEEYVNPVKASDLSTFKRITRQCRLFYQGRTGASLATFYIFVKFLYIVNLILQIIFLQYFLSYDDVSYLKYGFYVLINLFSGSSLPESKLFPRVTLCDFQIRELGERHYYTVECVLVINIFIEKMYVVLWVWFGILLLVSLVDIVRLCYRIFVRHARNMYIIHNLDLIVQSPEAEEKQFRYFLHYFPIDSLLILRIISSNANSLIVAEILWELFQRKLLHASDV